MGESGGLDDERVINYVKDNYLENVFESLEGGSNYSLIIEDYKE